MGEHTSKPQVAGERRSTLGELIHAAVRTVDFIEG